MAAQLVALQIHIHEERETPDTASNLLEALQVHQEAVSVLERETFQKGLLPLSAFLCSLLLYLRRLRLFRLKGTVPIYEKEQAADNVLAKLQYHSK